MSIERIDIADDRWRRFVGESPDATPFHHPAWASALAAAYGYDTYVLVVTRRDGTVAAGVPVAEVKRLRGGKQLVCLPFTDHCSALGPARDELEQELVAAADARTILPLEIRSDVPVADTARWTEGVVHRVPLERDVSAVFARFDKNQVRRAIRKAERERVGVARATNERDLVETFYALHVRTRRRLGTPVQPRRYFAVLWRRLVETDLAFALMARHGDTTVAGAFFLAWNGTLIYKYGASDERFRAPRPNHAIFAEAIRWGCENGFHTLDLGRSDVEQPGLRAFKAGWGAIEEPLVYSRLGGAGGRRTATPGAVAALIRRSPPWVCRALGEVFYRFAA